MKIPSCMIAAAISLFGSHLWAAELKGFDSPLAFLQKGPVHFDCRELAETDGFGQDYMKFDLSLAPSKIDPSTGTVMEKYPLVLTNVQEGVSQGKTVSYFPFQMKLSPQDNRTGGQLMFEGTPYERIDFEANESNQMTGLFAGQTELLKLDISQDIKTKLVVLRWVRTVQVDQGLPNCGFSSTGCVPRQRTISDDVLLCEPQP